MSLAPLLRRAWLGYQLRVDEKMARAGFADRVLPEGRVLRMCMDSGASISQIGRELGITRQGAGKLVANLVEPGIRHVVDLDRKRPGERRARDHQGIVTTSPHYAGPVGRSTRSCDDPWERLPSPHLSASQAFLALDDQPPLSVYLRPARHSGALRRPED